jgi:outer membrane receptor protein involved in Fe transport
LKPIKADQIEAGLRGSVNAVSYDLAVYYLTKRDDILSYRNTATNFTQTVNAGKTSHQGVELGLGIPFGPQWRGDVAFSYARHQYDEWATTPALSGKEIEAAPRILANTRLTWTPMTGAILQLEWIRIGSYWMDAANTTTYPGHDLFNLRGRWPIVKDLAMFGSVYNLADKRYADSASISSSTPVYSPGLPRTYYAGLEAKW